MQKPLIKHASFTIKAGSYVGICGERGAGKSTSITNHSYAHGIFYMGVMCFRVVA
jgi:ABC-type glutathione transport system ATPase component